MTILQQLLTAFAILVSLPLVIKLLWKIRLLPFVIGLSLPYLMGRQWTAAHRTVYLALLIGGAVLVLIAALIMNSTLKLGLPLWAAVVLGAVGAVLGEIGDLSFSIIKRQTGIKDYGHIFPGHGGVLDRFDSVIFVAPFAEFLFRIVF